MKESTRIFAGNRCDENITRMKREAKGDYSQPVYIGLSDDIVTLEITEKNNGRKITL